MPPPAKKQRLDNISKQPEGHVPLKQRAQALLSLRKALPIWSRGDSIRQSLLSGDVLLLAGETGSGKSTQIPQFLIDEPWCQPRKVTTGTKVGGCIAITQPRRVAAINLARRVAEEMGTPLGNASPASKVGYSVRFDNSTSPSTRIKFLTEGMLLQEMLRDPWLKQYSAVVVDEVHERGVNVDLVLGFLNRMIHGKKEGRGGVSMKVVIMSATADINTLKDFFTVPSDDADTESSWSGCSEGEDNARNRSSCPGKKATETDNPAENHTSIVRIEGRQYPVKIIYTPTPVQDVIEASVKTIFEINRGEPLPGDILVFLTGQSTVESLASFVQEYSSRLSRDVPKLLPLPLFAALPQHAQQRVFTPAPPRTRKVIISTNIAETSVTVPGVRYVIDCGKSKMKQFRSQLGLDSLLVKPISKSAAIQRSGRAGREAPGTCYRLYTQLDFQKLVESTQPEILRCDLAHSILTLKARGVMDITSFPFITPPPRDALEKALIQLHLLEAIDDAGEISSLGRAIARLPLSAPLGRALLAAAEPETNCLAEMIDIIAALSVENIFLPLADENAREKAEVARRSLIRREGDHLTLLAAVRGFLEEETDRKRWAEARWISHRAMKSVIDVRKQLLALSGELVASAPLASTSDLPQGDSAASAGSTDSSAVILKALLKGFPTNVALLAPDRSYRTIIGRQTVAIHPSSVLFGKKVEAILYTEYVFTSKSYARSVSALEAWAVDAVRQ